MAQIIKIFIIFIFVFLSSWVSASIVYEKEGIIITSLEIEIYNLYINNNSTDLDNKNQLIKEIYLIKNTLKKLKEKNPKFMSALNQELNLTENSIANFDEDLLRYKFIRNEFIKDYFFNELSVNDITSSINTISNLKIPLSSNKCLTVDKLVDIHDLKDFDQKYFNKIKDQQASITYEYSSKIFDVCFNDLLINNLENSILKIIEKKTLSSFKNFIYEK